jgi:hypothetical protein
MGLQKVSLAAGPLGVQACPPYFPMKRLPLLGTAVLALVLSAGCSHIPFFGKKSASPNAPKPSSKIATDTEKEFEQRWVAKRSGELVSQGLTAEAAQAQATTEFKERFAGTHAARQ